MAKPFKAVDFHPEQRDAMDAPGVKIQGGPNDAPAPRIEKPAEVSAPLLDGLRKPKPGDIVLLWEGRDPLGIGSQLIFYPALLVRPLGEGWQAVVFKPTGSASINATRSRMCIRQSDVPRKDHFTYPE